MISVFIGIPLNTIPAARTRGMWIATLEAMTQLSSREFDLLKKEIEVLGEAQERERLENRAALDQLKIEVETLRRALQDLSPEVSLKVRSLKQEINQLFDPEKDSSGEPEPAPAVAASNVRGLR